MSIFALSYPLAPIVLGATFILGIIISSIFFGTISIIIVLILINIGAFRILPIVDVLSNLIDRLFPDRLHILKKNLNVSFPIYYSCELPNDKQYIYLFHPHGLFSISHYLHIGTNITDWKDKSTKGTALYKLWWVPFGKEILETFNFIKSNYNDMKSVLLENKSLSVTPGGVKEIMLTSNNKITLNISSRRGIFKMALETGTPLVPILVYGENESYKLSNNWLLGFINSYLLKYNFCIPLPCLESCKKWISLLSGPLDEPIKTYVGKPIKVEKITNPTDEDIVALRNIYIVELKKLYKATKPQNYEDDIIII